MATIYLTVLRERILNYDIIYYEDSPGKLDNITAFEDKLNHYLNYG